MKKFRCIKKFEIYLLGINGFETGEYEVVPVGSLWELDDDIDWGDNHLESIDLSTHLGWIEIDDKGLRDYFEEV